MKKEANVSPWDVSGKVDYNKLSKQFGTKEISQKILENLMNTHPILWRGNYFAHRDFDLWIKDAEAGKKVSILTGRGPSEKMHLGHLVPFLAAKALQDKYDCNVYIPISEDEKFFVKKDLSLKDSEKFAEENILDIIALGFKPSKTFIMRDFSYPELYKQASQIAKLITYSEAKSVFGLKPGNNIGWTFYPAVQAAHILLPQFIEGKHRTLVPVGIDQDPFIRLTRDVAEHPTLKFTKPSAIHSKFIPSLKGSVKMSSSEGAETNLIYLSDSEKEVKKKINKYAFSGGKDTLEEHRKHGGNSSIDISFQYLKMLFEKSDKTLKEIEENYKSGKLLSGELKQILIKKINSFLKEHQEKRKSAKKQLKKFMID